MTDSPRPLTSSESYTINKKKVMRCHHQVKSGNSHCVYMWPNVRVQYKFTRRPKPGRSETSFCIYWRGWTCRSSMGTTPSPTDDYLSVQCIVGQATKRRTMFKCMRLMPSENSHRSHRTSAILAANWPHRTKACIAKIGNDRLFSGSEIISTTT